MVDQLLVETGTTSARQDHREEIQGEAIGIFEIRSVIVEQEKRKLGLLLKNDSSFPSLLGLFDFPLGRPPPPADPAKWALDLSQNFPAREVPDDDDEGIVGEII